MSNTGSLSIKALVTKATTPAPSNMPNPILDIISDLNNYHNTVKSFSINKGMKSAS
jgi:hypothetical protein